MKKIPPIYQCDIIDKNVDPSIQLKHCCFRSCEEVGLHPAPKPRPYSKERYWFCLEHIRRYNASWNYFDGMSAGEVDAYQRSASSGHRPTWKMGIPPSVAAERILNKVFSLVGEEMAPVVVPPLIPAAEREALAVLDLTYPVDVKEIKARYKKLVKLYHPDVNTDDKGAQDKFVAINKAYTYLINSPIIKNSL